MAIIISITRLKRTRRAEVAFDDGTTVTLALDLVVEQRLSAGGELSARERREVESEDARRRAVATALRLLAGAPRSEHDLRSRLRDRRLPREAADAAVLRMRELGYLDDAAFARFYVESKQSGTPRSSRFLRFQLERKGVDRETAAQATETISDEDAAYQAADRRRRAIAGLDRASFQRRLGAFLTSRGFGYGVARTVIDRMWREQTGNPE